MIERVWVCGRIVERFANGGMTNVGTRGEKMEGESGGLVELFEGGQLR